MCGSEGWATLRIVLCAGTHGGRYLLGGRRADDAAAWGVVSVCCGGAARRYVHTYIRRRWGVRDGVVECVVGPLFVGLSWVRIVRACVLSWVEIT